MGGVRLGIDNQDSRKESAEKMVAIEHSGLLYVF
jgi:hypothetical protein